MTHKGREGANAASDDTSQLKVSEDLVFGTRLHFDSMQ